MSSSGVRIGDVERERAVTDLGDHFAAGRLTRDELDERLDRAWQARTAADLAPLFADLPHGAGATPRAGREQMALAVRSRGPGPGFPWPLLLILAVVLTVVTKVPFVMFFVGWFVLSRVVGGHHRRPHAIGR